MNNKLPNDNITYIKCLSANGDIGTFYYNQTKKFAFSL